jgi:hypothetical protein
MLAKIIEQRIQTRTKDQNQYYMHFDIPFVITP